MPLSGFLVYHCLLTASLDLSPYKIVKALNNQIGTKLLFSSAEQIFKYIKKPIGRDLSVNIIVSYTAVKGLLNEPVFVSLPLTVAAL